MGNHGTDTEKFSQEILCGDCGQVASISKGQLSFRCGRCGNIEFFGSHKLDQPFRVVAPPAQESNLPISQSQKILTGFGAQIDGIEVQKIMMRYQVEWQIWAMVVKHFSDPIFHAAYLCRALSQGTFGRAMERYREHRSLMILDRDSHWQAEVADIMLKRLENLSIEAMKTEARSQMGLMRFSWVLALQGSRVMALAWFFLGLVLYFILLGWIIRT